MMPMETSRGSVGVDAAPVGERTLACARVWPLGVLGPLCGQCTNLYDAQGAKIRAAGKKRELLVDRHLPHPTPEIDACELVSGQVDDCPGQATSSTSGGFRPFKT